MKCSNTACPHDGKVKRDGELCEHCKRREQEINELTFQFFNPKHVPSRRMLRDKKKDKQTVRKIVETIEDIKDE